VNINLCNGRQHLFIVAHLLIFVCADVLAQEEKKDSDDATVPSWRYEFQKKYELFRDYGYDGRLGSLFTLTPEDGLLIAAGPILYHFGFRTFPYVYRMELVGGLSIPTGRFKILYNVFWPSISEHISLELKTMASELEVRNFYGFGNDNPRDEAMEETDFYRVSSREYSARPMVRYSITKKSLVAVGVGIKNFKVREKSDRFLNSANLPLLGNDRTLGSVGIVVTIDTRDHATAPHSGFYFSAGAWNSVEILDDHSPFQRIVGELRAYVGDTLVTDLMLALRFSGEKVEGRFPFFEAAYLGGTRSLRGYPAQRFAGDAAAFGSVELRFSVGRWKLIVPTEVGLFVLGDAGRVWLEGESPGKLHANAGGGLWLAPVNRDALISFAAAASSEGLFVSGGIGFGF